MRVAVIALALCSAACAPSVFWVNGAMVYPCQSTIPGHGNYPTTFYAYSDARGLGQDYGVAVPCVESARKADTKERTYILWKANDRRILESMEVFP
jgi:hypothetical protein